MTAYTDNAAGRLHNVLSEMKSMSPNTVLGPTWAGTLGIERNDRRALLDGLAMVAQLAADAQAQVRELGSGDEEMLLRWVEPVTDAIHKAHLIDGNTGVMTSCFTDTHLENLEFAAREVHLHRPRRVLSGSDIESARGLVDALLTTLRGADDLDSETLALLIRHAAALQTALNLVGLVGVDGIEDALAGSLGAAIIAGMSSDGAKDSDTWQYFWLAIGRVSTLLLIAQQSYALTEAITRLLGS